MHPRRLILACALLLLGGVLPAAAQYQGFISSNQCVTAPASGLAYGGFGVTGTWTGTLTAYGAVGQAAPVSLGSVTADGSFTVSVAGYTLFEVCGNTVGSGSAFVQLTVDVTASPNGGGVSTGLNGGILGTEGTCAATGFAPAVGVDLLCPSSLSGPLSSHGWLISNNGGAWQQLGGGSFPDLTDVAGVSLSSGVPFYFPLGTSSAPGISFTGHTNVGWYRKAVNTYCFIVVEAGGDTCDYSFSGGSIGIENTSFIGLSTSSTDASQAPDSTIYRVGVGIVGFGTTGLSVGAKLEAAGYISAGTRFTTNNGCTDGANAGGATAGYFVVGSTSCTEVVTMGNSATAPNGWSCTVADITTLVDVTNPHQTTSSATTATFVTGTVVSGDKIQFSCIGY